MVNFDFPRPAPREGHGEKPQIRGEFSPFRVALRTRMEISDLAQVMMYNPAWKIRQNCNTRTTVLRD